MGEQDILVSIFCITYNHEKYIEQMLESVVGQKTNFNYEVLVHDDASVDNTKAIIEKYANIHERILKSFTEEGVPALFLGRHILLFKE